MATALLELNDAEIKLFVDGSLIKQSTAYAVLDGKQLLLGNKARTHFKLLPGWTNNRYLQHLNTDPIACPLPEIRHHADIAYQHLCLLRQALPSNVENLLVATPSHYNNAQLSLFLGIAKEAKLHVTGLIDNALLPVADTANQENILFLDISLHDISLHILSLNQDLSTNSKQVIAETGLATLHDRWASIIARQFIQTARYDPMHQAISEQQLFDRLPQWVTNSSDKISQSFDLNIKDLSYSTQVTQQQLLSASAPLYPNIMQHLKQKLSSSKTSQVFLSQRFKGFPDLLNQISALPHVDASYVNTSQTTLNAHLRQIPIDNQKVVLTNKLKLGKQPAKRQQSDTASHLLIDSNAYLIGDRLAVSHFDFGKIELGDSAAGFCLEQVADNLCCTSGVANIKVNGNSVKPSQALKAGDQITLNGRKALLIRVQ